jgi:hypothetical protein
MMTRLSARTFELVTMVLFGAYTRALERAAELEAQSRRIGHRPWELMVMFIRARVQFELGEYGEAELAFVRSAAVAKRYGEASAFEVHMAWLARALVYQDKLTRAGEILATLSEREETLLFGGELEMRRDDLGAASVLFERGLALGEREAPPELRLPDWRDGFAMLEDRTLGHGDDERVVMRLLRAQGAYVKALLGHTEEGARSMRELTREQPLREIEPFYRLYFLWYGLMLPEARSTEFEDRLTVLGRAVKSLQERTSRIDSYTQKLSFLQKNYWNRRLWNIAQELNLM